MIYQNTVCTKKGSFFSIFLALHIFTCTCCFVLSDLPDLHRPVHTPQDLENQLSWQTQDIEWQSESQRVFRTSVLKVSGTCPVVNGSAKIVVKSQFTKLSWSTFTFEISADFGLLSTLLESWWTVFKRMKTEEAEPEMSFAIFFTLFSLLTSLSLWYVRIMITWFILLQ